MSSSSSPTKRVAAPSDEPCPKRARRALSESAGVPTRAPSATLSDRRVVVKVDARPSDPVLFFHCHRGVTARGITPHDAHTHNRETIAALFKAVNTARDGTFEFHIFDNCEPVHGLVAPTHASTPAQQNILDRISKAATGHAPRALYAPLTEVMPCTIAAVLHLTTDGKTECRATLVKDVAEIDWATREYINWVTRVLLMQPRPGCYRLPDGKDTFVVPSHVSLSAVCGAYWVKRARKVMASDKPASCHVVLTESLINKCRWHAGDDPLFGLVHEALERGYEQHEVADMARYSELVSAEAESFASSVFSKRY